MHNLSWFINHFQAKHDAATQTADDQAFWGKMVLLGLMGCYIIAMAVHILQEWYKKNEIRPWSIVLLSWILVIFIFILAVPFPFWKYED